MKRRVLFVALALALLAPFRATAGESVGGWDLDGTSSPRLTGLAYLTGSMQFTPPATSVLTGSINPTASTTLTGVGTRFTTELMIGDKITVSAETRTVVAIASDTSLTVDTATTDTANDASVDRYPVGLSITGADTSVATDLRIYPAVKSSGNLFDFGVGTTSKLSCDFFGNSTQTGAATALRFVSTFTNSAAAPAFSHTGTQTTWGSIFKDSGTVGVMNGDDTLNIFDGAITNSNHTGSNNRVNVFNAGNITGDAEASEYVLSVGTGWDAPIALAEATANGTVAALFTATSAPTGAQTAIQGWIRVDVAGTPRYVPFW